MARIIVLQPIPEVGMELLYKNSEVIIPSAVDVPTILAEGEGAEALIVKLTQVGRELIEGLKDLKIIGRFGVGLDNIDLEAAKEKGVTVINTPGANALSVAEFTLMAILLLSRKILQSDKAVRMGDYQKRYQFIGNEIKGKSLGIVGFGAIGKLVARLANAFGVNVQYYDPYLDSNDPSQTGRRAADLRSLLKTSDFVSLHVPLTKNTENIISSEELKIMKKTAYLINVSRGRVVDEKALYESLVNQEIAGAAVDVLVEEPFPKSHPLYELENVLLTPHMAGVTTECTDRIALQVASGVLSYLKQENAVVS